MDANNMKNIIILKNLPSNLVDEAIVILKHNKKVKKLKFVDNKIKSNIDNRELEKWKNNDFFVKEAENVISDYISKIEKQDFNSNKRNNRLEMKYKKLKIVSIFLIGICLLSIIVNFI